MNPPPFCYLDAMKTLANKMTAKACYDAARGHLTRTGLRVTWKGKREAARMVDVGEFFGGKTVRRAFVAIFKAGGKGVEKRLSPRAFATQIISVE